MVLDRHADAQSGVRRGILAAVAAGFVLLLLAATASIVSMVMTTGAERAAAHSIDVRRVEAQLFSSVQDAETAQRGYLLTHDPSYLEPLTDARARLPRLQSQLHALVGDNPVQEDRLDALDGLISAKMAEIGRTVDFARQGQQDGALALVHTNLGQSLMRRIRAQVEAVDHAERALFQARQAHADLERTWLVAFVVLAVALVCLLALMIGRAAQSSERQLARQNLSLEREIAQRKQAESQLRQAQKMEALGQLTGGIAHDFNNMLAIIVGSLDILIRRLSPEDARLRAMAENALAGANRAAALTQRLLAFSRLQPLNPKTTDINKCVGDMSEMLRRTLGEKVAVETVLAGGLWRGFVDSPQLESAILNLAVNARDAMPEGGRLTLETGNASLDQAYADTHAEVTPGQYVMIAVTDTGKGMSLEVMDKAFDPFFTTKRVGHGTGLGLSQVHGFLKQSRGHVKIYSEIGVGTTVKLYLPRDLDGTINERPIVSMERKLISRRFTILVVEDDAGVRSVALGALKELGFEVVEADSGVVALERLAERPEITLLLTDVVMPQMNGRQLADRALAVRPDLRVVYMTGYTRNAIVHNGVLDPGTRLITKPFTVEALDRELRLALDDLL